MSAPFNGLDVAGTGQRIKDWVVARFEESNQPLPERRYCAPGDPRSIAWDCEQFVVALGGIGWGQALDESSSSARTGSPVSVMGMRHAVYTLQLVRCTPQPEGREKLRAAGFAPPAPRSAGRPTLIQLERGPFRCPWGGSTDTRLDNVFGPTPCRSLRYCNVCRQPFEQFKTI